MFFDDLRVTHSKSPIVSTSDYYAFGLTFNSYQRENSVDQKFKFQGQEHIDDLNLGWDSFKWRNHQPDIGRFFNIDPLADKYVYNSPYAFSENRVIDGRELEGLEWVSTKDGDGKTTGYMWDPKNAYTTDQDGNQVLKEGYYNQAIFFSENGTFDKDSKYNIGSSTATVYKADGTTETFDASTYPSDQDSYATVPEGDYEATVGLHKGSYTALRVHDVGNTQDRIELGEANPSDPSRTYAEGINIHKPGLNNLTGLTSKGQPCSAGCFLVDRDSWDSFIQIFSSEEQKNNPVGISLSRTYSEAKVSKRGGPRFEPSNP